MTGTAGAAMEDRVTGGQSWNKAARYFGRAMLLRCPVCGKTPVFPPLARTRSLHDWFTPLDGCPRCGYAFDREPGYFLLSIWAINYGIAAVLGLVLYGAFEWFFDWPVWTLIAAVVGPVVLFNVLFVRHSKTIFIAWDHFFDPHEREDDGGDGNVPHSPEPPPRQPPRRARLPADAGV
ncbi:MAG: DUF983 domain-containing protein [Chthoniobacterales bacterium]|nr:DUF983 domain-containing protein [Chthoniobacterales bacterium]